MDSKNRPYVPRKFNQVVSPSPQKNEISTFDVNLKLVKDSLKGTESQKTKKIKQRILKFFDYGKDQSKTSVPLPPSENQLNSQPQNIRSIQILRSLQFDMTKIILYSPQAISFQKAQKIFPNFLSFQKIDDKHVKITFNQQEICQNLLWQNAKLKNAIIKDQIFHPIQLAWFQISTQVLQEQNDANQAHPIIFARYATNKDQSLFKNDDYFRDMLKKVKTIVNQKTVEQEEKQLEAKQTIQRKKMRYLYKRKLIQKSTNHIDHKRVKPNFDIDATDYGTNYGTEFKNSRMNNFYFSHPRNVHDGFQRSFNQQRFRRKKVFNNDKITLEDLNISQIRPMPIALEQSCGRNNNFQSFDRRNNPIRSNRQQTSFIDFSASRDRRFTNQHHFDKYSRPQDSNRLHIDSKDVSLQDYDKQQRQRIEKMIKKSGSKPIVLEY